MPVTPRLERSNVEAKSLFKRLKGAGEHATISGAERVDALGRKWNPSLHPRDSRGRFIETGGIARTWEGKIGRVLKALGGRPAKVLLQFRDGTRGEEFANRLTMIRRPDGSLPTSNRHSVMGEDARRVADTARGDGLKVDDHGDANHNGIPDHLEETPHEGQPSEFSTVKDVLDHWRAGDLGAPFDDSDSRFHQDTLRQLAGNLKSTQLSPDGTFLVGRYDDTNRWFVYHSRTGSMVAGSPESKIGTKKEALALARALEGMDVHGERFDWNAADVADRIHRDQDGVSDGLRDALGRAKADVAAQPKTRKAPVKPNATNPDGTPKTPEPAVPEAPNVPEAPPAQQEHAPELPPAPGNPRDAGHQDAERAWAAAGGDKDKAEQQAGQWTSQAYQDDINGLTQSAEQRTAAAQRLRELAGQPEPKPQPEHENGVQAPEGAAHEPVREARPEVLDHVPAEQGRGDSTSREGEVLHGAGSGSGGRGPDAGAGHGGEREPGRGLPERGGEGERRQEAGSGNGARRNGVPAEGAGDGGPGAGGGPASGGDQGRVAAEDVRAAEAPRFRPQGQGDLAPSGQASKVKANIEALRTLRQLEAGDRPATAEEQAKLARWAGWGAVPDAVDPVAKKSKYVTPEQKAEIASLLGPQGLKDARHNTLNAHYTDAGMVDAIWKAVEGLGFHGGAVGEPGSGSGNFIGHAPDGAHVIGVELDPVTAGIAKYLYPDASILNESFGDTNLPLGSLDAVVGNVPFGKYPVSDPRFNKNLQWNIHNHFIIKSLALTKPGGTVALLTSRYTMDSEDDKARREMAKYGDLVTAVRLPGGAHQKAAGTSVITDLLVFRRRGEGEPPKGDQSWIEASKQDVNGYEIPINNYFQDNPGQVLGEVTTSRGQFTDHDYAVVNKGNVDKELSAALTRAVRVETPRNPNNGLTAPEDKRTLQERVASLIDAASSRHEGHIAYADGKFTTVEDGHVVEHAVPKTQAEELKRLTTLRDLARGLLDAESKDQNDSPRIRQLRQALNDAYDDYAKHHGPINRFTWGKEQVDEETGQVSRARVVPQQGKFRKDPASAVVYALEKYDPDTGTGVKASIFEKRVVAPRKPIESTNDPGEALAVVLDTHGHPDLTEIARLLGTDEKTARERLGRSVFDDPEHPGELARASVYLSGDVRTKLEAAREAAIDDPKYAANVDALEQVLPKDLLPGEIDGRMGAAWIEADDVQQFLREATGDNYLKVQHPGGSLWTVDGGKWGVESTSTWGTTRMPAGDLAEKLLTQKPIEVFDHFKDAEGRDKRVINADATELAQAKASELQERFSEWLWEDPKRAERLSKLYNERFNSLVMRQADTSPRALPGLSDEWRPKIKGHQYGAVDRMVTEPTALLDHVVGSGKTAEMVMGSQELRRLGLANKPTIVIPNHMLEQFTREFLELYPQANLLAAGSKDLTGDGKRRFIARAATGDWDAIILTQKAFQSIPMSRDAQLRYINDQVAKLEEMAGRAEGTDKRTLKQAQDRLANRKAKLEKLMTAGKDEASGLSFEHTGVDYVMVDEAHHFKNLFTPSQMRDAAIDGSDRSTDLDMKLHYLRSKAGDRGRVATFATGTPIANSVSEQYVMTKYLRPDLLDAAGIDDFDSWVGTFGEPVTDVEITNDGKGFKTKTRLAKFRNVPELLRMWGTFTDTKTKEDLNLPTPDLVGGRPEMVEAAPTDAQRAAIEAIQLRMAKAKGGQFLRLFGMGRRAAQDLRLISPGERAQLAETEGLAPEHARALENVDLDHANYGSKIGAVADRAAGIWEQNKHNAYIDPDTKLEQARKGALQIVFMDQGTPKEGEAAGSWNAYEHLRDELAARGVPADQVRFIHEAKNDKQKAELFQAARDGRIAVLIGSTEKMGVGTNVQQRAVALHHVDIPWRPADVEQREGRILRQGNQNPDARILRYVTQQSFDAYSWQTIERKARFIGQVKRGKIDAREMEDLGDAVGSFAVAKASASGNPRLMEAAQVGEDVKKYDRLARGYEKNKDTLRQRIKMAQSGIADAQRNVAQLEALLPQRKDTSGDKFAATITDQAYTTRKDAGAAVTDVLRDSLAGYVPSGEGEPRTLGRLGGFDITYSTVNRAGQKPYVRVQFPDFPGASVFALTRDEVMGMSGAGLVTRLENRVAGLDKELAREKARVPGLEHQITAAEGDLAKPFRYGDQLTVAKTRQDALERLFKAQAADANPEVRDQEVHAAEAHLARLDEAQGIDRAAEAKAEEFPDPAPVKRDADAVVPARKTRPKAQPPATQKPAPAQGEKPARERSKPSGDRVTVDRGEVRQRQEEIGGEPPTQPEAAPEAPAAATPEDHVSVAPEEIAARQEEIGGQAPEAQAPEEAPSTSSEVRPDGNVQDRIDGGERDLTTGDHFLQSQEEPAPKKPAAGTPGEGQDAMFGMAREKPREKPGPAKPTGTMEEGLLAPENAPEKPAEAPAEEAPQPETPAAEAPTPAGEPAAVQEADQSPGSAAPAPPADVEQPAQPQQPQPEAPTPASEAPKLGDLKRATAKGHGLTDGDRAWVADRVGTVRAGTIRKNGSTYTFEPDDHQVPGFMLGRAASKFSAQKIEEEAPSVTPSEAEKLQGTPPADPVDRVEVDPEQVRADLAEIGAAAPDAPAVPDAPDVQNADAPEATPEQTTPPLPQSGDLGLGITFENADHGLVLDGNTFKNKEVIKQVGGFRFAEVPGGGTTRFGKPMQKWTAEGTEEERGAALARLADALGVPRPGAAGPDVPVQEEKFPPTPQQQDVIDAVKSGQDTVVRALAGTGKTSTLEMIARRLRKDDPKKRIAYIAFNKVIQTEAEQRMPGNVESRTDSSIAFVASPEGIKGKFRRMKAAGYDSPDRGLRRLDEVAKHLGVTRPIRLNDSAEISPEELAGAAIRTVENYAISADDKFDAKHVPDAYSAAADQIVALAEKAWKDLRDPNGRLRIENSHITKMWALTRPDLSKRGSGLRTPAHVIFFDEAQDINPVMAKVIADQHIQKVYVGDSNQAIYGFRGAQDELDHVQVERDLPLTKSWRFGPEVADAGNRFLQLLGAPHRVEGGGGPSTVHPADTMTHPDAVLVRSNAGAIGEILAAQDAGRLVGVPKDTKADLSKLVDTAAWLKGERGVPTQVHDDLAAFRTWAEVKKAAEKGDDPKVTMLARIVDAHGTSALRGMVEQLVEAGDGDTRKPDVVVTTAHKAKGLEWDRVKIGPDFRAPRTDPKTGAVEMPSAEENRLAYVAVTRARKELDPGSLAWVYEHTDENGGTPGEKPNTPVEAPAEHVNAPGNVPEAPAVEAPAVETPQVEEPTAPEEPAPVTVGQDEVRRQLEDIGAEALPVREPEAVAEAPAPEPGRQDETPSPEASTEATPEPEPAPEPSPEPAPEAPSTPEPAPEPAPAEPAAPTGPQHVRPGDRRKVPDNAEMVPVEDLTVGDHVYGKRRDGTYGTLEVESVRHEPKHTLIVGRDENGQRTTMRMRAEDNAPRTHHAGGEPALNRDVPDTGEAGAVNPADLHVGDVYEGRAKLGPHRGERDKATRQLRVLGEPKKQGFAHDVWVEDTRTGERGIASLPSSRPVHVLERAEHHEDHEHHEHHEDHRDENAPNNAPEGRAGEPNTPENAPEMHVPNGSINPNRPNNRDEGENQRDNNRGGRRRILPSVRKLNNNPGPNHHNVPGNGPNGVPGGHLPNPHLPHHAGGHGKKPPKGAGRGRSGAGAGGPAAHDGRGGHLPQHAQSEFQPGVAEPTTPPGVGDSGPSVNGGAPGSTGGAAEAVSTVTPGNPGAQEVVPHWTRNQLDASSWNDLRDIVGEVGPEHFDQLAAYMDARQAAEHAAAAAAGTPQPHAEAAPNVGERHADFTTPGAAAPHGGGGQVGGPAEVAGNGPISDTTPGGVTVNGDVTATARPSIGEAYQAGGYPSGKKLTPRERTDLARQVEQANRDVLDNLVRANPSPQTSIEDAGGLLELLPARAANDLLKGKQIPLRGFLDRNAPDVAGRRLVNPKLATEDTLHFFDMNPGELAAAARSGGKWSLPGAVQYAGYARAYEASRNPGLVDGAALAHEAPGAGSVGGPGQGVEAGAHAAGDAVQGAERTAGSVVTPATDVLTPAGGAPSVPGGTGAGGNAAESARATAARADRFDHAGPDGWADMPVDHLRGGDLIKGGRGGRLRQVLDARPAPGGGTDVLVRDGGNVTAEHYPHSAGEAPTVQVSSSVGRALDFSTPHAATPRGALNVGAGGRYVPADPTNVDVPQGRASEGQLVDLAQAAGTGVVVQVDTPGGPVAGRLTNGDVNAGLTVAGPDGPRVVAPGDIRGVRVLAGRVDVRGTAPVPVGDLPAGSRVAVQAAGAGREGRRDRVGQLVRDAGGVHVQTDGGTRHPVRDGAQVRPVYGYAGPGVEQANGAAPGVWTRSPSGAVTASAPGEWSAAIVPQGAAGAAWRLSGAGGTHSGRAGSVDGAKAEIGRRLGVAADDRKVTVLPRGDTSTAQAAAQDAPTPVMGAGAEWAPITDLVIGDQARVDGWSAAGQRQSYAGHVIGVTPVLVDRQDGHYEPMLAVTLGEDSAGMRGWRGTVVAPIDSLAARVPTGSDGTDELPTSTTLDVLAGRLPEQIPTDGAGLALFPGSVVSEVGGEGRTGIVTQARRADVSVQWGDGKETDASGAQLRVDHAGPARPAGWTRGGQRVQPGMVVEYGGRDTGTHAGGTVRKGVRQGTVESVDGDTALVSGTEGLRPVEVAGMRVVGQSAPDRPDQAPQAPGRALVEPQPASDLEHGDVILLTDDLGDTVPVVVDDHVGDGDRVHVDYTDGQTGTPATVDLGRDDVVPVAVGDSGDPVPIGGTDPAGQPDIVVDPGQLTPPDGPTGQPQLLPAERDAVIGLGYDVDGVSDPVVATAAARVRAGQPLTADEADALATAVTASMGADGADPTHTRLLTRAAEAIDAVSGHAAGRETAAGPAPDLGAGQAVLAGPRDLTPGDMVAIPGAGGMPVGRVTRTYPVLSGRMWHVDYEQNGERRSELLAADRPVWRLPDVAEPTLTGEPPARLFPDSAPAGSAPTPQEQAADAVAVHAAQAALSSTSVNEMRDQVAQALTAEGIDEVAKDADPATRDAIRVSALRTVNEADPLPGETPQETAARVAGMLLSVPAVVRDANRAEQAAQAAQATQAATVQRVTPVPAAASIARDARAGAVDGTVDEMVNAVLKAAGVRAGQVTPGTMAQLVQLADEIVASGQQAAARQILAEVAPTPGAATRLMAAFNAVRARLVTALRNALARGGPVREALRSFSGAVRRDALGWEETQTLQGLTSQLGGAADTAGRAFLPGEPSGFDARVDHWRALLPAAGMLGRAQVRGRWYGALRGSDLPGEVRAEDGTRMVLDRAVDGGPGATALAHVDALRGLGRAVSDEVTARVAAALPDLGPDTKQAARDAQAKVEDARRRFTDAAAAGDKAAAQVRAELDQARADADTVQRRVSTQVAQEAARVLAEIRGAGGDVHAGGDPDAVAALRWAAQHVPADWLQAVAGRTLTAHHGDRGWYDPAAAQAALASLAELVDGAGPLGRSALHELWHHIEDAVGDVKAAEWAYHWHRTSTGDVGARRRDGRNAARSLAEVLPGRGHSRIEMTREDGFADPYVGREFTDQEKWELGAMAFESLFGGSPYLDDDLEHWLLGVLAHVGGQG